MALPCWGSATQARDPDSPAVCEQGTASNPLARFLALIRLLETVELLGHGAARRNEVRDNTLIDVEVPLVFAEIANLMRLVEDPPGLRTKSQGVRQHLKDNVTLMRPKAFVT